MSLNTLESLIQDSHHSPDSNKIYDIVENFPKYEKCQIQLSSFEKLCRIPLKIDSIALLYCFGKSIETLLFYKFFEIDSFSPNSIIDLLNCLIYVHDRISGTNLSKILLSYIEEFMNFLIKKDEISEEERLVIKELNENLNYKKFGILDSFEESAEVEEILFYVKSKHIEDKICGTQKLIQFMNSSKGFEEQLELLAKKLPNIIKYIIQDCYQKDERKIKELLLELSKLITTIVGEFEFFVNIDKEIFMNYRRNSEEKKEFLNELSKNLFVFIDGKEEKFTDEIKIKRNNDAIVHYKITNYEDILQKYENIYSSIALIINTFLLHPNSLELQEISFRILSKLFIIFPKFRKNLEEPLLTVLTRISENDVSDLKKEVSIFLFKITHKYASEEFIKLLSNKHSFKAFYDSPFYSEKVFKSCDNTIEAINPANLIIRTVFPIEKNIEAGKSFEHLIEVFHPFSIIYIGFATQYYDISFNLKLICLFNQIKNPNFKEENHVVYKKENINTTKNPCRIIYFAKKPGLYKIEFDNCYSWINNKCIRYKLLVLQPQNLEFFMTGESLDNIVEEVMTYESLDMEEQKKLVRKLSRNFNKISLEKKEGIETCENCQKCDEKCENCENCEKCEKSEKRGKCEKSKKCRNCENQIEKLKFLFTTEKDNQDIQIIIQIKIDFLQIIIKSSQAESEWMVNNEDFTIDLSKFYGKINDFFKRKHIIEENEMKNIEKQLISILFVYNQQAMDKFLHINLKNYSRNTSLKQNFIEIFDFEKNLPKYFEGVFYHFIRDVNLFFQMNFANSHENKLQKKETLLLVHFSQGSKEKNMTETPFLQAFLFDKTNSSNLFQSFLNINDDLSRISFDFTKSLKRKFEEIFEKKEEKTPICEQIIEILTFLLYNLFIVYKEKMRFVVIWESGNKALSEEFFKEKDLKALQENLIGSLERFYERIGEDKEKFGSLFRETVQKITLEEKNLKVLNEI